jgi:hypothetical protein
MAAKKQPVERIAGSIPQCAARGGFSEKHLRNRIAANDGPPVHKVGKRSIILFAEFDEWLGKQPIGVGEEPEPLRRSREEG